MLKAINTKILLAILAALLAIGGALAYQRHEAAKAAAAAASAAIFSNSRRAEYGSERGVPAAGRAGQEEAQLRRRERRQNLAEVYSITHRERVAIWFPWHCWHRHYRARVPAWTGCISSPTI